MSARVCFVVGARPNFMKSAPVHRALAALDPVARARARPYGPALRRRDVGRLLRGARAAAARTSSSASAPGTHAEQTAKALVGVERVLRERETDLCVVAGDVNSTLAGALAAVEARRAVAHIESGLRSFDRTMPEEHNRMLTDHLSDVLLAHSEDAVDEPRSARASRPSGAPRRQHDDRLAARARRRAPARAGAVGAVRRRARRLRARDAAPAGARRRPGPLGAVTDGLIALATDAPGRLPGAPADARTSRRPAPTRGCATRACIAGRRSATSTSSGSRRRRARRHRLRRRAGGDVGARRPLLHAARHDRAAGHGELGTNTLLGASRSGSPRSRRCSQRPKPATRSRSGTARPANARPRAARAERDHAASDGLGR